MAETEKSIKAFTIPYEAWYKDAVLGELNKLQKALIQRGKGYENGNY